VGSVTQIVVLIVLNLIVDPIYYGMPYSAVVALVPTALLPFNAAKAAINSVLTFLVYKRVADAVRPAKKAAPKSAE
jgi:riboflavin transporter FmnP